MSFDRPMKINQNPYYVGFVDFFAGSLGGAATVAVGQPLDTVKVKMQAFPERYGNLARCFMMTLKNEGFFRGLYAGTSPSLVANVIDNSFVFCAHGYCKKVISSVTGRYGDDMTVLDSANAGFLAGFFSSLGLCPTELIKCKLQALRETNSKPITATQLTLDILRVRGLVGLYSGFTSTVMREMPGYFAFFYGIGAAEHLFAKYTKFDKDSLLVLSAAGGAGGMCLWLAIFPFDVVKSRIQIENSNLSMTRMLLKIYRDEGFKNLYKGLSPTLLRTFPASAALYITVAKTKALLL